ncbi:hypothetical protein PFISCL1PPCAC_15891, partial [Pristionchus fissidentatus]
MRSPSSSPVSGRCVTFDITFTPHSDVVDSTRVIIPPILRYSRVSSIRSFFNFLFSNLSHKFETVDWRFLHCPEGLQL